MAVQNQHPTLSDGIKLNEKVSEVFRTQGTNSHFFGYYDICPLDISGKYLLSHSVSFDGRDVTADDTAIVGYWNIETEEFKQVGITRAFNWQQGSRLQWLPPDYSSRVIYNDRRDNKFVAVIVDIKTGKEQILPFPIYAVHPSGEYALALNYERLYFCRPGYNYQGVVNPKWDCPVHNEDGIFRVDLNTGVVKLLLRTRDVYNLSTSPQMEKCNHWLEYINLNPSGTRFVFMHRWDNGKGSHKTRLFSANPEGTDIYMFPDTGSYSHMGWRTDNEFTIWGVKVNNPVAKEYLKRSNKKYTHLIRAFLPLYRCLRDRVFGSSINQLFFEAAYLEFWDKSSKYEVIGKDILDENGHESWCPTNKNIMLTDTYSDKEGFRHLLVYAKQSNQVLEIGRFVSHYNETGYRCDLHPRWDLYGTRVIIDSAHDDCKKRQMYVLDIKNLLSDHQ